MRARSVAATLAATCLATVVARAAAAPADIGVVGITVGSLGNPYYVATDRGISAKAAAITPRARLVFVAADYDLAKQFTQMDNFIAAGAKIILIAAADPNAIAPAVERAKAAGVVVGAFDSAAKGANFTIMTDNVAAGTQACQYIVDHLRDESGDVLILNGPQVSPIRDRVSGCKAVFAKHAGIHLLSSTIDGRASRDGGLSVGQDLLARFPHLDAVFAVNDQSAIGLALAAKQLHRSDFIITCVDGSPDIVAELKDPTSPIKASAAQDPARMAAEAYGMAVDLVNHHALPSNLVLMQPKLVTSANVADYPGWNDPALAAR